MIWPPKLNKSRDLTTPLSVVIYHQRLELATINVPTKFEVYIFTHYKHMKGDTKYGKLDGLGQLRVIQHHWK